MKIRFFWKELTDDGLLKVPRDDDPHSMFNNSVNEYGGFETKEAAIAHLKAYIEEQPRWLRTELVLVEVYEVQL